MYLTEASSHMDSLLSRLHTVNGQAYLKDGVESSGESHIYGQHAGPFWLAQAIQVS